MIQGLYAAANGMMSVEDRQAVIANNIANVTTAGFKRQIPVQKGFDIAWMGAIDDLKRFDLEKAPGGGVKAIETFTNYTGGIIEPTGNSFDVALLGPGFIKVQTPAGERFTRNGRFGVGGAGELVTTDGHLVVGADGGPIDVSGGAPVFHGDGTVTINGEARGRLSITEFEDPHALVREGFTLLVADDATTALAREATGTSVVPEALELSNVQIPHEMVQLMMALRAYAANQRVIQAIDETSSRLIDQVGNPG